MSFNKIAQLRMEVTLVVALLFTLVGGSLGEGCSLDPVEVFSPVYIQNHRFSASSSISGREPFYGRLNGGSAWIPASNNDDNDYLQIDLGSVYHVCAVGTQGNPSAGDWTTTFKIETSLDNLNWTISVENSTEKNFTGNLDKNSLVMNNLSFELPAAKFIRFYPITFYNNKALRVEVYGSMQVCSSSLGNENNVISNLVISALSIRDEQHQASDSRLYGDTSWCSNTTAIINRYQTTEYLEVDFGQVITISGVATQGDATSSSENWVTNYEVRYGHDGNTWSNYGGGQLFTGNTDNNAVVVNWFSSPFEAQYVRIVPRGYNNETCMRMDIFGCKETIDNCSPNPCEHVGNCTDGFNNYSCDCVSGYGGKNCSINIDECSPNPCEHGENCTDGINDYSCDCVIGYDGKNCSININDCSSNPCEHGGNCTDGINDYSCDCVIGYDGKNCSINIDECSPNPCEHGENCTDGINDYSCDCVIGYDGKNCSININDCSPNPCEHGENCTDGINDYSCHCVSGYGGKNCSINIDECSPNPCEHGGNCTDGINEYSCDCVVGYDGKNCSTNINDCSPNPCEHGGNCIDGINDYSCDCVVGYDGKNCSINIDDCSPNPCENTANCTDGINDYNCNCSTGFKGKNCTLPETGKEKQSGQDDQGETKRSLIITLISVALGLLVLFLILLFVAVVYICRRLK